MKKLILAAMILALPPALRAAETACLYDLSGTVETLRPGEAGWRPALKGRAFAAGDRVRTAPKAWCELLFSDGSFVRLEGGSEAGADELRRGPGERLFSFSFLRGRALWMAAKLKDGVKSRFSVRTPSAVCAVRGTDFSVVVSTSGETTAALFEGRLALEAAGEERELLPGQEAAAAPGRLTLEGRLSKFMQAEERRCARLRGRVERLRARLAEREDYIDEFIEKRRKTLSDFDARREKKLGR